MKNAAQSRFSNLRKNNCKKIGMERFKSVYFLFLYSMMNIQNLGSGDRYIYQSFALKNYQSSERLNSERHTLK